MTRRPRLRGTALRASAVATAVLASLLGAVLVVLPAVTTGAQQAAADTPWGSTGASYRAGLICALPDGRRVALASWAVAGTPAFSTADVVARGSTYGAAPRSGTARQLTPGTRGLSAADLTALAYLIGHAGAGSAVQVAETSALVAQALGGGAAQRECLGRQGTSAAAAATLELAARRFAGPYTVQLSEVRAKPGSDAPVSAVVRSAAGVATPGIAVSFAAGGAGVEAVTGADGQAGAHLIVPASGVVTATVAAPTGLRVIASRPASVTLAAPRAVVARTPVVAVLHPTPQLTVAGSSALVLSGGSLTPTATVAGSYGYAGTGSVSVVGPVRAPAGGSCSDVDLDGAPTVWSGAFSFTGDGARPVGSTGALTPGCYGFLGRLSTTDATPAVTATAAADPARSVGVSALQVTQSVGSGLARTGALAATVTATAATGASVASTLTTYGPLPATDGGRCDTGVAWTRAKAVAPSVRVALAAQGTDRLSATVRTPAVTAPGCYALVSRSTVSQDGRTAVVSAAPGAAGTTVMVIAPTVRVTNSAYDGRQGVPMTGHVHVTGTLGLTGRVAVGLVSAPAPATGCHGLTFAASASTSAAASSAPAATATTVDTAGDGDYRFRSPVPTLNRCYGVVATLSMTGDPAVRVAAPAPGDTAVFLAGASTRESSGIVGHSASSTRPARELAVFGVAGAVVLVLALALMVTGVVAGERKPDPRAGELLVDFSSSA